MANFSRAKTTRKMHQMSPNCIIFQKFSGGACPRTPLAKLRAFGARFRTFGAQKWSHQYEIRCYGPETIQEVKLSHVHLKAFTNKTEKYRILLIG